MSMDNPLSSLERLGYRWGNNCNYWVMWTMWEPKVLDRLYPLSNLKQGEGYKIDHFNKIINQGFSSICSDPSFKTLEPTLTMRYLVIKSDFYKDTKEPFQVLSETVEIEAFELAFKNGKMFRYQPISFIACAGLAEVLRSICKKSDLLIVSGTYEEVFNKDGKCVLLLNYDNIDGELQILRLPFSDADEIYMVEKIKPTNIEKRFQFKYFVRARDNPTRKEITRHQDFKWVYTNSQELDLSRSNVPLEEFSAPIQNAHDPFDCYMFLLSDHFHLVPKDDEPSSPGHTEEKWGYEDSPENVLDFDAEFSSPVFFATPMPILTPSTPKSRFVNGRSNAFKDFGSSDDHSPLKQVKRKVKNRRRPTNLDGWTLNNVFEIFGKFVVLVFSGVTFLFLALFLISWTSSCCIDNQHLNMDNKHLNIENAQKNYSRTYDKDHDFQNHAANVFVKMRNIINSFAGWILRN